MRDSLIPTIQEFDSNIMKGFDEYIKTTKFLENYWDKRFRTWRESIIHNDNPEIETYYTIDKMNEFYQENYTETSFWIKFWFSISEFSRPSNKSLRQFIEKLKMPFKRNFTHIMGKQIKINVTDKKLIIKLE